MTEKVLKTLDAVTFQGSLGAGAEALQRTGEQVTVDVGARLREMW
jgi:hypothetical protein